MHGYTEAFSKSLQQTHFNGMHILREAVGGDKHGALSISRTHTHTHTHTHSHSLEELEVEKFVSTVRFYLLIDLIFSLTSQILEYCF